MVLSQLQLTFPKEVRPNGIGYKHGIRDHPSFCHVCTNFDWNVAEALFMMREGLYMDTMNKAVLILTTMRDVAEAANEGCAACMVIMSCSVALGEGHFDPDSEREISVIYCEGKTMQLFVEKNENVPGSIGNLQFELMTLTGQFSPWPSIGNEIFRTDPGGDPWPLPGGKASIVPTAPFTETTLSKVVKWIEACEEDHPWCDPEFGAEGQLRDERICPKRLIHIGANDADTRLIETQSISHKYIALSYCWGGRKGLRLERATISDLFRKLPFDNLLTVHQDAIGITRKLGFRYLWVDALCIIQDSRTDQLDEIQKMSSIYAHASITIAATGSPHAEHTMLPDRDSTLHMSLTDIHDSKFSIYARKALNHEMFEWTLIDSVSAATRNNWRPWQDKDDPYPLFSRAWCFQERLLSRRILHFTAKELVWECLASLSCECGSLAEFTGNRGLRERRHAAGIPHDIELRCGKLERGRRLAERLQCADLQRHANFGRTCLYDDPAFMFAVRGPASAQALEAQMDMSDRWRELISQYSRRDLTFASDALPAISGLAAVMHAQQDPAPRYAAGAWEHSLHRDLLWHCIDEKANQRPRQYLAPSWSWASVRRAVDWPPSNEAPHYHVTEAHVDITLAGRNPFGEVIGGRLRLHGLLVSTVLELNPADRNSSRAYTRRDDRRSAFLPDCIPKAQALADSTVFCLWWCTDVNDRRTMRGFERALVLAPAPAAPETYTRIGLMLHFPLDEWHSALESRDITIV